MPVENNQGPRSTRSTHLCPWWMCFAIDNFLRRMLQNPERVLKPFIKPGWTVLDVGPGIGYFTITLARLVGDSGKVIAADIQRPMLDGISKRANRAGVQDRILLHLSTPDNIGIDIPVDFCLAFWMVHEVPEQARFLREVFQILKPDSNLLLVEPKVEVSREDFELTIKTAGGIGFTIVERPVISLSQSVLLCKPSG